MDGEEKQDEKMTGSRLLGKTWKCGRVKALVENTIT